MRRITISHFSFLIPHSSRAFIRHQEAAFPTALPHLEPIMQYLLQ